MTQSLCRRFISIAFFAYTAARSSRVAMSNSSPRPFFRWQNEKDASAFSPSTQIPPADFYIPVLGQLAPAQLLLGNALEVGPLEVGGFHTLLRGWPLPE